MQRIWGLNQVFLCISGKVRIWTRLLFFRWRISEQMKHILAGSIDLLEKFSQQFSQRCENFSSCQQWMQSNFHSVLTQLENMCSVMSLWAHGYSPPGSQFMGFSGKSGVGLPFLSLGSLSDPGTEPCIGILYWQTLGKLSWLKAFKLETVNTSYSQLFI